MLLKINYYYKKLIYSDITRKSHDQEFITKEYVYTYSNLILSLKWLYNPVTHYILNSTKSYFEAKA